MPNNPRISTKGKYEKDIDANNHQNHHKIIVKNRLCAIAEFLDQIA